MQAPQNDVRKPDAGQVVAGVWWQLFHSRQIDNLLRRAFLTHPDAASAQAALRQAQDYTARQHGYFNPAGSANNAALSGTAAAPGTTADASGPQQGGTSSQANSASSGAPAGHPSFYELQTAQLTVGYQPELLDMPAGQEDAIPDQGKMQLEASYITLASNIVAAAVQEASLRSQIEAQLKIVSLDQHALEIVRNQLKLGYITEQDEIRQEMVSARAQVALVPLQQQLEQTRELLRVLVGPDQDVEGTDMTDRDVADLLNLDNLHVLQALPASLPSRLVRQRPDVRIAEARLESAGARYGAPVVRALPQFSVTGAKGGKDVSTAWMARSGGEFFANGDAAQAIFGERMMRAKPRDAREALARSGAQYRGVVMAALQNMADSLQLVQADDRALKAAMNAAQAASTLGNATREQYRAGSVDFQNLWVAQQNELLATIEQVRAQANLLGDTATLLQALGGGWWRADAADNPVAEHP